MVNLNCLVSHRFPLERTPEAFAMNDAYRDNVVKIVIEIS
jgi:L-iditol 2-dehydrogenase